MHSLILLLISSQSIFTLAMMSSFQQSNLFMLEEQRYKSSFDTKQMGYVLMGGKENYERYVNIQKKVAQDDVLRFNPQFIQTHRKQNMLEHAKKLIRFHEHFQFDYFMKLRESTLFFEQMPLSLHFFMFLITLNNLCTDKQAKLFYQRAVKGEILGCYGQTELAHGSDIQNLMTTATYDSEKQEFIIDSPCTGAVKWWIGDLGNYANHAIIFAQLIIHGKNHGLHAFLVPIRDDKHNLLPNVEAGDIGPKYGYHTKDNGYVKFNKHRIGRQYMLMRYAKVQKNGEYSRRGNQRISYATMLIIRSIIPVVCSHGLAKASTILTRYSLVRTQFKDDNGKEIPILDYQLQQDKIIPRIAESYALMFGTQKINQISRQVFYDAKERSVFDRLNQAHSLTSGVKAVFTTDALRGIEILRRAAGGHGFHMYSGLPSLLSQLGPTPTFQGQNSVLYLQTARYLLKMVGNVQKKKPLGETVMYLQQINNSEPFIADYDSITPLLVPDNMRKIFLYNSCQLIKKAGEKIMTARGEGAKMKQIWDYKAGLALAQCGRAHTYYWIFQNFLQKIYSGAKNEKIRQILTKVLLLYGSEKILQMGSIFFESGVITSSTIKQLQNLKQQLLRQLRPEALGLVQSFGYLDNTLHSAIGWADGKSYNRLLEWAQKYNRVNRPEVQAQINEQWKKTRSQLRAKL